MTASIWQRSLTTPLNEKADVAIIGAGLSGLSLAYWLSEARPQWRIVIVEREAVAAGASGRNAGFVTAGSTAYLANLIRQHGAEAGMAHWNLKQESLQLMRQHLLTVFPNLEYTTGGSTTLYRDEAGLAEAQQLLNPHVKLTTISSSQLQPQGLNGFSGGLQFPEEGSVHPVKLMGAIQQELQRRGVQFIFGQSVGWASEGRLILERGELRADHTFVALNGYVGQFAPLLGELVQPKRAQMVAFNGRLLKLAGNFYDPAQRVYFRRHVDGTVLIGGLRLLDEAHENSDFDKVTQVIQQGLETYAETTLGLTGVVARWSGVMGFTSDEKPLVKEIAPGMTFVGGYSGHGMGMAFGFTRRAVQSFLS